MKNILKTFLCLITFNTFAVGIPEWTPMYQVISDSVDVKIPVGKCLITGVVWRDDKTINEATIFGDKARPVNSDKLGRFKILVDSSEMYLVIHKGTFRDAYVEGYKFKSQHHVHLKIMMPLQEEMIMSEKPIIYVYSPIEMQVELKIQPKGAVTFTYPQIDKNNSWNITTKNDGAMTCTEQEFPYLFWESENSDLKYLKNEEALIGRIIQSELIITYLEEQLTKLGLNSNEKTDFITYWGPRLVNHNYSFIQFKIDDKYNDIATIEVTPKPDNMRRVYMQFTGFESFPSHLNIAAPDEINNNFNRKGLTILEWGGSEIPLTSLMKQL